MISLTAYVDTDSASKLNLRPKELEVTLILHTIFGKDHFISITGEYGELHLILPYSLLTCGGVEYTCFANNLARLTRLPGPIRSLKSPDDLRSEDHPINAPREIMRLVNWMMSDHVNVVSQSLLSRICFVFTFFFSGQLVHPACKRGACE